MPCSVRPARAIWPSSAATLAVTTLIIKFNWYDKLEKA